MQSLIYRHTTVRGVVETTTLYIFGVPIYRHRYIGDKEEARKPCGFQYYGGGDAPVDDEQDDEDFDTFIIEPYGKEKAHRPGK